ncbi:MAG: PilZ domain-containing protein [Candidatus Omnitrophica bacterium]|nr:PilZ domain-containing protein [Candidatus Omnitrophota bacterium]
MQDHRQAIRWRANWQAKIRLEAAESGAVKDFTNCLIYDITLRGLRVCLPEKMEVDTAVKFSLVLCEDCHLEGLEAWVAWHKAADGNHSYGLYFTRINDPCKEKLYRFTRENFCEQINKQWWKDININKDIDQQKGGEEMEDRRIFERMEMRLPLNFLNLDSGIEGQAHTADLSAKGVGMIGGHQFEPKTPLEMWLNIPDKCEPLYLRGEVVWSRPQGVNEYRSGISLEKADLMGISRVLRF